MQWFLFGTIVFFIWLNYDDAQQKFKKHAQEENELFRQLDDIQYELGITARQRDSLFLFADSVNRVSDSLFRRTDELEKQLVALRRSNKYKNVGPDSLGLIMDARARENSR